MSGLTIEALDQIETRLEAATPIAIASESAFQVDLHAGRSGATLVDIQGPDASAIAYFTAFAAEDLRALIDEVRRQAAQIERLEDERYEPPCRACVCHDCGGSEHLDEHETNGCPALESE